MFEYIHLSYEQTLISEIVCKIVVVFLDWMIRVKRNVNSYQI